MNLNKWELYPSRIKPLLTEEFSGNIISVDKESRLVQQKKSRAGQGFSHGMCLNFFDDLRLQSYMFHTSEPFASYQ